MQIADSLVVQGKLSSTGTSASSASDALTAVGTSQATGLQLTAMVNNITTAAAGTGVNLPASAAGLQVTVENNGANAILVYPLIGATDTINGIAATIGVLLQIGSIGTFICSAAGAWTVQTDSTKYAAFNTNVTTVSATLSAANVTGGLASVDLALTGTLGSGQNVTLPLVTALTAAMATPTIGSSYRLRIINESSANFAWTVVTNTGWTLTGTMTINQSTWREFVVTLNTLTTATLQSVAVGTYS
jgi:hypothetical protein